MRKLNLGAAGLGRAFALMAPTLAADTRVAVVAGADPRPEARRKFSRDFSAPAYPTVDELCADPRVDVVYVATPHQLHAENACLATSRGKHVLVEKPMALALEECRAMVRAARGAGVHLVVGHSHSFDAPISHTRSLIQTGAFGRIRMISALNYTDFLYRPRRAEELDAAKGGGAVMNQAAHHVDVVRFLSGGVVKSVRAMTGAWDSARPVEGAYSALLALADGAFATLAYSGYGHFDSDELLGWIGEGGQRKDPARHGGARLALTENETELKNARNYGGEQFASPSPPVAHPHFGFLVVSCEHADLRPTPQGVWICDDRERRLENIPPPAVPRAGVIDELYAAVVEGRRPLHDGAWGLATVEVCLAMLRSAREGKEIALPGPTA
ncbi:MAG TPA: Gfo/Idh/MocA family oxidoreductase [Burkholderiales bacterium]|jgi:phthalate 4,5-cis-dihydrodiol dehydrogenase|nr:Gfo/Idh/MocA family oxidoreductase [Burkholderiales bacterium]